MYVVSPARSSVRMLERFARNWNTWSNFFRIPVILATMHLSILMLLSYRCFLIRGALHEEFNSSHENLKFPNKFSSTLILIGLVLGFSCGVAGCNARSNRAWLRDSGSCSGKLSSDQEVVFDQPALGITTRQGFLCHT